MKRWAICKMGDYEGDGSRSPKVAMYTPNWRAWSHPTKNWAVCQFAKASLTGIDSDSDIHILPDATLDAAWSSIPTTIRSNIVTKVQAAGYTTTSIKTTWTIRQILAYLVGQDQANINIEHGDIQDIE